MLTMTPFDVSEIVCQRASHEERNESLEVMTQTSEKDTGSLRLVSQRFQVVMLKPILPGSSGSNITRGSDKE
jgi:hypothetical protein